MSHHTLRRSERLSTQRTGVAAQNARLVRRVLEEIWNDGDLDLADRLFARDYVNHGGLIPDLVHGPEAIKVSVVLYRTAFPHFRVAVLDVLAQGQLVALRWAARGTPCHPNASHQLTRNPPSDMLLGMTFGRVSEGQIVESWTCWESGSAENSRFRRILGALARGRDDPGVMPAAQQRRSWSP
jgi:predicted SnoaL-like aldol condensation-catalyzing enzyme